EGHWFKSSTAHQEGPHSPPGSGDLVASEPDPPAQPGRPVWRDARRARQAAHPSAHHQPGPAHLPATSDDPGRLLVVLLEELDDQPPPRIKVRLGRDETSQVGNGHRLVTHVHRVANIASPRFDGLGELRILLAKVMSKANENDYVADQVRCRPGRLAAAHGQSAGQADPRGTGSQGPAGAVRHAVRRARRARAPGRDDAGRAGSVREGAAAVHDQGHRCSGGTRPAGSRASSDGQAAGSADRHGRGPEPGRAGAPAEGGVAGQAAAGAERAGALGAAGGRAGAVQAQPVLTAPAAAGRKPASGPHAAVRRLAASRMFGSLANRNYRLFAAGQVVSNTGSWMQRVAQDWLVLELTHGSGTALGITTGLQFLPMLASPWGGVIADRYSKRAILMLTQALMGGLAVILGLLALTGTARIWHVYVLALVLGMITAVDNPT